MKKGLSFNVRVILSLFVGLGFGMCLRYFDSSHGIAVTKGALQLVGAAYIDLLKC